MTMGRLAALFPAEYLTLLLLSKKQHMKLDEYCRIIKAIQAKLAQSTSQHDLYYKACAKHFPVLLLVLQSLHKVLPGTKLAQSTSPYYFVLQSLHKVLPGTTSYYKVFGATNTKFFPVLLLRITKLAQYYFVLQNACTKYFPAPLRTTKSLHKVLPSTTSYYKKLAQSTSQLLLRSTKLAQSTSRYCFVLQSLHKVLPSTTSYYKACTKLLPSTTSYYKACTKYFPVLLRTTKLAQSTSRYYFVQCDIWLSDANTH